MRRNSRARGSIIRPNLMPETWTRALAAYRYPVVRPFSHALNYPRWRQPILPLGDRTETIAFEEYFRGSCQSAMEPWAEVVFWKMASQRGRADIRTREILDRLQRIKSPEVLWDALTTYVAHPTKDTFDGFRLLFGFRTKVIAIAATFPAFVSPALFPMVDTRIAKWVRNHFTEQIAADPFGPKLVPTSNSSVLTMSDFLFVQQWTRWCRHTAIKLQSRTGESWRARDVEMAVFQAQGDGITLNALPAL
jgi:hypothetical protein